PADEGSVGEHDQLVPAADSATDEVVATAAGSANSHPAGSLHEPHDRSSVTDSVQGSEHPNPSQRSDAPTPWASRANEESAEIGGGNEESNQAAVPDDESSNT